MAIIDPAQGGVPSAEATPLNDIRICDKCRHIRVRTMLSKLQRLAPDADIKVACKSYCGPCSRYAFVFVNGRYVTAPTEDEAVAKAGKYIRN